MEWMRKEIGTGLQKLICLGLDRSPAYELIQGTMGAWMEGLTFNRSWDEDRDTQRIRDAFSTVIRTRKQWPSVADFLECMPVIRQDLALPAKTFTDTERLANLDRLADLAKEIGQ